MADARRDEGVDRRYNLLAWLELVRSVARAFAWRRLALAAVGMVLLTAGWEGLNLALSPAAERPVTTLALPGRMISGMVGVDTAPFVPVVTPIVTLFTPWRMVFQLDQGGLTFFHGLAAGTWGLVVWGLIGGAIARMTAIEQATGRRIGLAEAVRFAGRKAAPLIAPPLIALLGVGLLGGLCGLFGLLYQVRAVGPVIGGAAAFAPLLLGLTMAWLLIGLTLGWPLMVASIAVEGEDAFDALSRSFGYVFQRPVHYAFYVVVAGLAGSVGAILAGVMAHLVLTTTTWGLAIGAPDDLIARLFLNRSPGPVTSFEAVEIHAFWRWLVAALVVGWTYSYFWTAATWFYLLLRREVDDTELDEVDLNEPGAETGAAALAAAFEKPSARSDDDANERERGEPGPPT